MKKKADMVIAATVHSPKIRQLNVTDRNNVKTQKASVKPSSPLKGFGKNPR